MAKQSKRAVLAHHMERVSAADTVEDLEAAFQAGLKALQDLYGGWMSTNYRRASGKLHYDAVIPRGLALADAHPLGSLLPRFEVRSHRLTIDGEQYRVGRGGNSTGARYAWTYATEWARETLVRKGLSQETAKGVLDWWSSYPHRALGVLIKGSATLAKSETPSDV